MKHTIKKLFTLLLTGSVLLGVCSSCEDDPKNYDNKAFINSAKVSTVLLMGINDTENATIRTAIAKLEAADVKVAYTVDSSMVAQYNRTYDAEAILVPGEYYEIPDATSTIVAGKVTGNDVEVNFKNLLKLDRNRVYVLPVTVANSTIGFLDNSRTVYFVVKGAALINTVANITENHLALQSAGTSTLKEMKALTVEALIRVNKFGKQISTIMGIESKFLIRIGDAGVPDDQIQLATSGGNVTDAAWKIPTNEWVHLAVTYNSANNGAVEVYMNGVKKGSTQFPGSYNSAVDWAAQDFYIGKSYNDDRWLEGDISECRIWDRVLAADEIKAENHYYIVAPKSEGLKAYWKFNEGSGQVVTDHTGNGNTMLAGKSITWKPVSLPK